ncbi:pirin family protein [Acetobacter oeni]|uniref:Quercetin 2,3-dioxygenase n=1 Tax=Acetobacter oeni TaxID=304077 RepID=A0A511XN99_9PROT|nr:hypothetical protein [Acetobacter oeni]MBB3884274.1 hypothetical protein [Acetobacter oeni]NHO20207.1 hypothetical protein [Acetobacter oeni]GBR05653.1 pirin [Acetobacter oeni LMG 21952]GEN64406.1 quercetin 2,3-dioxygenase [Acetobacter oeni]
MIVVRRQASLGVVRDQGIPLRCHFSFRTYTNPACGCCGRLRALNAATSAPGEIYRIGPEASIDILTWLLDGALSTSVEGFPAECIGVGGLHAVSTGEGVSRLEWRAGADGATFLQFWFLPDEEGGEPSQETRLAFPALEDGGFRILASGFPEDDPEETQDITDGSPVTIRSRSRLMDACIPAGEGACYDTTTGRALYLIVVSGRVTIGNDMLAAGDAAAVTGETTMTVIADENAVVLLADTAASETVI